MHVPGTKVLARIKIVLNPHINDPYARALNPSIFWFILFPPYMIKIFYHIFIENGLFCNKTKKWWKEETLLTF